MIFRRMEKWSVEVGDRTLMTEVCRDTMQYAQALFIVSSVYLPNSFATPTRMADLRHDASKIFGRHQATIGTLLCSSNYS